MRRVVFVAASFLFAALPSRAAAQALESVTLRGQVQTVHLYGPPSGDPVVVSSGDGGWLHLGPHVARALSARGFFVVGFDVKAYLESFTSSKQTLAPEDVRRDYEALAKFAGRASGKAPLLVGVSEGAGLSLLAAADPRSRDFVAGVVGIGLPNINELGWRWQDSLIYITHKVPREPTFSAAAFADRVAPVPLVAIHSTHDEFVPLADVQTVMDRAKEPKRLSIISACDHRFSDKLHELDQQLIDAIDWARQHAPR